MIDFDKQFEEYVIGWYKAHADEFEDASEMEEIMPEIYIKWADVKQDNLGGKSPNEYLQQFDSVALVDMLVNSCKGDNTPCALLLDRIAVVVDCAPLLKNLLEDDNNIQLKMISVNLLIEMGASHPLELYVSWLTDSKIPSDLRELGVEVLVENSNSVKDKLFALIEGANNATLTLLAEILINADKDERTYNLLIKLFSLGDNIPLYASYIGKYGDERAAGILFRALDTCNYLEYIEIKNAIERMGGNVEVERDFSEDIYYKAIKNIK